MPEVPGRLITYCTNIHPGETWEETLLNVRTHVPAVRRAVSPGRPFPVGLRLSNAAAQQIDESEAKRFRDWLLSEDLFVPTVNGFPFGEFHGGTVKERVYLPDWRDGARGEYTKRLADLLALWLPEGMTGSISTVPVGYGDLRGNVKIQGLTPLLRHLAAIRERSGKRIVLCLEPEPACFLETTDDVIGFFEDLDLHDDLRGFLGVCFDCCHQAVEFEDAAESLQKLSGAGIPIGKVQVSSALRLMDPDPDLLRTFAEPCYLHQVVIRSKEGSFIRFADLPEALERHSPSPGDEWRVHFHVPVFAESFGPVRTTRFFIEEALPHVSADTLLEVETYSWNVLPAGLRHEDVTAAVIGEIEWVKSKL